MHFDNFKGYLNRAKELLERNDNVSISYCALELRKSIELIVWTQFKNVFLYIFNNKSNVTFFDFIFSFQSESISKMYEMLKKYSPGYSRGAMNKTIYSHSYTYAKGPLIEEGESCCIPGELPNSNYRYLSELIHYEKEFYPEDFKINKKLLKEIYENLFFLYEHYTYHDLLVDFDKWKEIFVDFKKEFNLELLM